MKSRRVDQHRTGKFWRDFLTILPNRPHQALGALYWYLRGRKIRARNRLRLTSTQGDAAYATWIETVERQDDVIADCAATIAEWKVRPLFSILVHEAVIEDFGEFLSRLARQCYPHWELVVVLSPTSKLAQVVQAAGEKGVGANVVVRAASASADDAAGALAIGLAEARGEFILPLPRATLLPPTALYRYGQALQAAPEAELLYGDHDAIDAEGQRSMPWFKPRWNAEMLLAQDYISQACVIRTGPARRAMSVIVGPGIAGGLAADRTNVAVYALALALGDRDIRLRVPHIQAHVAGTAPDEADLPDRLQVVRRTLEGRAEVRAGPFGTLRVEWPLPSAGSLPLVSIIVPTRDHVKLLQACVTGLLERTAYAPIEIIVVDNGSREAATLDYLHALSARSDMRVLTYDQPYNYAAINNFAAAQARGEYLCLLNNDTEVIDGNWLTELMRHAARPDVGAAGAMLLYDDGSIQHAGVVVGMKQAAGHAHRFLPHDRPGYFRYPHVPHEVSAVTAACLVVERRKFDAVDGLDETHLAVAFNDVDFCLKLQRAGWRNIYVPQAVMVHHESKSRGKDVSAGHRKRFAGELAILQQRWGTAVYDDPLHHPALDRDTEDFTIKPL